MAKKRVVQKLISFESKKKDYSDIEKELVDGWYIASIMPHKGSFLCVLEKAVDGNARTTDGESLSLKEMLNLTKSSRKTRILQDA